MKLSSKARKELCEWLVKLFLATLALAVCYAFTGVKIVAIGASATSGALLLVFCLLVSDGTRRGVGRQSKIGRTDLRHPTRGRR